MKIEELKVENKALKLLLEWAIECGFWFDSFHDEYETYKDELSEDMTSIDMMIHIAKRYLADAEEAADMRGEENAE